MAGLIFRKRNKVFTMKVTRPHTKAAKIIQKHENVAEVR
jgi:hypothetical protein